MATVYVPSPLRRLTGGQSKLSAPGRNIRELLTGLERQYPGIRQQVCDETGEVRSFINVFVNGTEIRQLQGMATPLQDADEVSIIPAMAGGGEEPAGPNLYFPLPLGEGQGEGAVAVRGGIAWPAR